MFRQEPRKHRQSACHCLNLPLLHSSGDDCLCSAVLQIDHNGYMAALGASNRLNTGINPANAWAAETILTCVLVFTVFAATDTTRSSSSGHLSVRDSCHQHLSFKTPASIQMSSGIVAIGTLTMLHKCRCLLHLQLVLPCF